MALRRKREVAPPAPTGEGHGDAAPPPAWSPPEAASWGPPAEVPAPDWGAQGDVAPPAWGQPTDAPPAVAWGAPADAPPANWGAPADTPPPAWGQPTDAPPAAWGAPADAPPANWAGAEQPAADSWPAPAPDAGWGGTTAAPADGNVTTVIDLPAMRGEGPPVAEPVTAHAVEVREPDLPVRRVEVHGPIEVGRVCDGVVVSDPAASRRHIQLRPAVDGLVVVDLGSTNGTTLNDTRIEREAVARVGDVIGIGLVRIVVTEAVAPRPPDVGPGPGSPPAAAAHGSHADDPVGAFPSLAKADDRPAAATPAIAHQAPVGAGPSLAKADDSPTPPPDLPPPYPVAQAAPPPPPPPPPDLPPPYAG